MTRGAGDGAGPSGDRAADLPADPVVLLDVALAAARAAGEAALSWSRGTLAVEEKTGPGDLVSAADRDAERAVREVLARHRPDDAVLGEEAGGTTGSSDVRWVVDPIDGTTNYVYGRAEWAVSVAAVDARDDRPLAGVVLEPAAGRATCARRGGGTWCNGVQVHVRPTDALRLAVVELGLGRAAQRRRVGRLFDALVPAVRDVRRGGSAALALTNVATGRADAAWSPGLQPWDAAAGLLLVAEAGGVSGDLAGRVSGELAGRVPASGNVLAAAPGLYDDLLGLLAEVYGPDGAGE